MAEKEEILLDLKVTYKDAITAITKFSQEKAKLIAENKKLADEMKKDTSLEEANTKAITANKLLIQQQSESIRILTKEVQNNVKEQQAQEGSLNQLSAQLSNMTAQYRSLSEEERNSAKGTELATKIKGTSDALKEAEGKIGDFRRNVGDYRNAITDAIAGNNKFAKSVLSVASNGMDFSGVMKSAVTSVKSFGVALKALALNPIGAVLTVIVTSLMMIKKGIESSESATQRFQTILAPFKRLVDLLISAIQEGVNVFMNFAEGVIDASMAVSKFLERIPLVGKYFKEANDAIEESISLQQRENDLLLAQRDLRVQNAQTEMEVAELKTKAKDKEKYTSEERVKFLNEAITKERAIANEKKRLAKEEYEIILARSKWADNDKETNDKLADAKIKLLDAERNYNNNIREMTSELNSLNKEVNDEEKARHEEWLKRKQERLDKAIEANKKEEDAIRDLVQSDIALMAEGADKEKKIAEERTKNEIEALKKRITEEANLTENAKDALREIIKNKEVGLQQELTKIDDDARQKQINEEAQFLQLKLRTAIGGSEEELAVKMQLLDNAKTQELDNAKLTADEKLLIEQDYEERKASLKKEANEKALQAQNEAMALEFQNKIMELELNGQSTLEIEVEQRKAELDAIQQMEGETTEEFQNRLLTAQVAYKDAKKKVEDQEIANTQAKLKAVSAIAGSLAGILDELGENNKAAAIASKALTLAQIIVDTGSGLAGVMAQAAKEPTTAQRVASYVSGVAMVLSAIASATKTVKSAKFATGGLVTGSGTGTSDSVPAQLSAGESVMNYNATQAFAPLLSSLNTITGGVPIQPVNNANAQALGEDMLTNAFVKGASQIKPVVAVSEINDVNERVSVIENLANYE